MLVLVRSRGPLDAEVISQVRLELLHRLNRQGVAVHEEESSPDETHGPELGDDAGGGDGLSRARGHLEVHPPTSRLDGTQHLRHGDPLVIP